MALPPVKLRRLRDKGEPAESRWVWQLVWVDPISHRDATERIGFFCPPKDNWRPPGKRLVRLSEREAETARTKKQRELAEAGLGFFVSATRETRERWRRVSEDSGEPTGALFQGILAWIDSDEYRRFREVCRKAQESERQVIKDLLGGWCQQKESDCPSSFDDVERWYFENGSPNLKEAGRKDVQGTFNLFRKLCPDLPSRWREITRDDAILFQNRLCCHKPRAANGSGDRGVKSDRRAMTVRKHLTNMRKVWNSLPRSWGLKNPWLELQLPKVEVDKDAWHYYSDAEVKSLLEHAEPDLTWKARIRLAWKSGLRPGEIDHLRIEDVNWDEARVHVRKHIAADSVVGWIPKDKDARSVPVDDETMLLLRQLKLKGEPGNPYLFVSPRRWRKALALQASGQWRDDMKLVTGKKQQWKKIVDATKLKPDDAPAEFYSLRKTCCCNWLIERVPAHVVQEMMGHSDLDTTLKWYTKVNKAEAERLIREAQRRTG